MEDWGRVGESTVANRDGRLDKEWEEVWQRLGMEDWERVGGSTAANRDGRLGKSGRKYGSE